MKYTEIESYFQDEELVLEILKSCLDTFNRIDEIGAMLRNSKFNNPLELDNLLKELNGINMFLTPILGVAESVKTENEDRYYSNKKIELEKKGEKIVSAVLDREASLAVANYRRVRNSLEAYVKVINTMIMSAQSLMKSGREERIGANSVS